MAHRVGLLYKYISGCTANRTLIHLNSYFSVKIIHTHSVYSRTGSCVQADYITLPVNSVVVYCHSLSTTQYYVAQ
jgi:hypothetical protein